MNYRRKTDRRHMRFIGHPWAIWYVSSLHGWWGVSMLLHGLAESDRHGGITWNAYVGLGGITLWGGIMLLSSMTAITALLFRQRLPFRNAAIWFMPQQFCLAIGALGVLTAMLGTFHDYETSRVLRVLPMSVFLLLFHTLDLMKLHAERE